MKTIFLTVTVATLCCAAFGGPTAELTSVTQDEGTGLVEVSYALTGAPAVVTMDVQTNAGENVWASIGAGKLLTVLGDVNVLVQAGEARSIRWKPSRDWTDRQIDGNQVRVALTAWATNAPPDYMVVDLASQNRPHYYVSAETVPYGVTDDIYKTEKILLRKIPAAGAYFRMGSPTTEMNREKDNREDARMVSLTEDFYLGVYELTQRQYAILNGSGGARTETYNSGDKKPANSLSWNILCGSGWNFPTDKTPVAGSPLAKLVDRTGVTSFTLPTSAQWEFACRAGSGASYYWGDDVDRQSEYAWSDDTLKAAGRQYVQEVGLLKPNGYGLYDMLGNIEEICGDWYVQPDGTESIDPEGPATGQKRWIRGGSYQRENTACRCAFPSFRTPNDYSSGQGARIACAAVAY